MAPEGAVLVASVEIVGPGEVVSPPEGEARGSVVCLVRRDQVQVQGFPLEFRGAVDTPVGTKFDAVSPVAV